MSTQTTPGRVLVVDDELIIRESFSDFLEAVGYSVDTAHDCETALLKTECFDPEVVLLDLDLPDGFGLDIIDALRTINPDVKIVVVTGKSEIDIVVKAMHMGAENFLVKPCPLSELRDVLQNEIRRARDSRLHRAILMNETYSSDQIFGHSKASERLRTLIAQVADTSAVVLLGGESGSGKGLAAAAIHRLSNRSDMPFLDINCAGLSETLLESELFGHEAGAFTDAKKSKRGLIEVANGGTFFLDEIGEMPMVVQSKFLKVLEGKTFRRVGGVHEIQIDIRWIAATNKNLKELAGQGQFREDLYYRLSVFEITVPTLRERGSDILPLAHHFLNDLNRSMGTSVTGISEAASEQLTCYGWPGNIRELRNVIERAVILTRTGIIGTQSLPTEVRRAATGDSGVPLQTLEEIERQHLERALAATSYNKKRTAEILQISRTTLYNKIRSHDLKVPD